VRGGGESPCRRGHSIPQNTEVYVCVDNVNGGHVRNPHMIVPCITSSAPISIANRSPRGLDWSPGTGLVLATVQ
jgi:hypothetical protein